MMTSTPLGLRLTSDPAVEKDGTIERECKPGQECKMIINIENTLDGVDVVFQRHVFLWDTGVFKMYKVTDRNGRGHAREAKNLHIKRGMW
ncbi:hypothetical protein DPMN_154427 [Dreissena polymorpha]|uniref:Uncharacterized protein n=1 Tax=Dreissena polymorpha TaxID=45954 RepID=A0A9D4FKF0_DREPO|nr:hypothetical protein DPMN_154427 [Dreissena polymorpha]